ncbi:MAG: hypothetical protein JXA41_06785 [Deltaproteobacteria bacterium]|nr:hypothetical protein [Deltaproteobacteria bacterium]
MEKSNEKEIEKTDKEQYEPPKATFVPLKIEERLMACLKLMFAGGDCNTTPDLS